MTMAVHPCPRCKRLIPVGVQYCEACRPVAEAQAQEAQERKRAYKQAKYNKGYNRRRDPKYLQFYRGKDWRTLSRAYLQSINYRCEAKLDGCTSLAVEVHHKQPIQTPEGWERRLDWHNLQAVCTSCHNSIHQRFNKKKAESGIIDISTLKQKQTTGGR